MFMPSVRTFASRVVRHFRLDQTVKIELESCLGHRMEIGTAAIGQGKGGQAMSRQHSVPTFMSEGSAPRNVDNRFCLDPFWKHLLTCITSDKSSVFGSLKGGSTSAHGTLRGFL